MVAEEDLDLFRVALGRVDVRAKLKHIVGEVRRSIRDVSEQPSGEAAFKSFPVQVALLAVFASPAVGRL